MLGWKVKEYFGLAVSVKRPQGRITPLSDTLRLFNYKLRLGQLDPTLDELKRSKLPSFTWIGSFGNT